MLNTSQKIGMAPFFHSDIPIVNRVSNEKAHFVILAEPANWSEDVCLFRLPEHLREKWWNLAHENLQLETNERASFNSFFDALTAFAVFKGIPILSQHYKFDVLVRLPGELYKQRDASKQAKLISVINLGDERTHVVVENEKILLEPNDGLWIPDAYNIELSDTLDKSDVDVLLLIEC